MYSVKTMGIALGMVSAAAVASVLMYKVAKYSEQVSFEHTGMKSPALIENTAENLKLIDKQCDDAKKLKECQFKRKDLLMKAMSKNEDLQKAFKESAGKSSFSNQELFDYGMNMMKKLPKDRTENENKAAKKLQKTYDKYQDVTRTVTSMQGRVMAMSQQAGMNSLLLANLEEMGNGLESSKNSNDKKIVKKLKAIGKPESGIQTSNKAFYYAYKILSANDEKTLEKNLAAFEKDPKSAISGLQKELIEIEKARKEAAEKAEKEAETAKKSEKAENKSTPA